VLYSLQDGLTSGGLIRDSAGVLYTAPDIMMGISVSPNGKKIAFSGGKAEWNVIETSLPEGRVHTVVGGGELSWQPEWAPSGTHFLFSAAGSSKKTVIEDQSAADGFSRQVAEAPEGFIGAGATAPRWAPDGKRFLFRQWAPISELMMSNGTGGRSPISGRFRSKTVRFTKPTPSTRIAIGLFTAVNFEDFPVMFS